jgi:sortase A
MHKKTNGNLLITLGILLIAAAAGLAGYNLWDAGRAQKAAEEITGQLISDIESKVEDGKTAAPYMDPNTPMPVEMIDGYEYIGVLEIPSEGLSLPVMNEWDYTRLKISPCRFTGSYYSDDLVICAHNYMRHLGPLLQIGIGEDIYFTSVDGLTIHYIVTNRETVEPTAVEQMIENTSNSGTSLLDWDLTLFTCNLGGQTRCAVRCSRAADGGANASDAK